MELTIVSTVCIIGGAHEYFSSDEFDNVNVDSTFFLTACKMRICAEPVVCVGYMNKIRFILFCTKKYGGHMV